MYMKCKKSIRICGLYYKHIMIVEYNCSIINKLKASITDDARVIIYDCHTCIVQDTGCVFTPLWNVVTLAL
jgi:hypothetical protein